MNKKIIFIPVVVVALALMLVGSVSAQEAYQYVNTSGNLQTVIADDSNQALATADNKAYNSGVILLGGVGGGDPVQYPGSGYYYEFVNTSGNVSNMNASSPAVALETATNLAEHSGVIYVNWVTSVQ